MPQTPPRYTGPASDPAAAIVAVAVPGMEGHGISRTPRDVVFVLTELGYVYRSVDGGKPALVFSPIEINEKKERIEP